MKKSRVFSGKDPNKPGRVKFPPEPRLRPKLPPDKPETFFIMKHTGAPGGVVIKRPGMKPMRLRKQDRRALPYEAYAVVFFPKITNFMKARIGFYGLAETLAKTPEAAIVKFIDRIGGDEPDKKKWKHYHQAGHRVRKIKITDLGDA